MYVEGNIQIGMTSDRKFVISLQVVRNRKDKKTSSGAIPEYEGTVEKTLVANNTNDLFSKLKVIMKYMKPSKRSLDLNETEFEKVFNQITTDGGDNGNT